MKLPKTSLYAEWKENPETRSFILILKRELSDDLFGQLKRACRSSDDPNVRFAFAQYSYVENLVNALEGKANDDQPRDSAEP